MDETNYKCQKCGNTLEKGFVPETTQHGVVGRSIWIEGEMPLGLLGVFKLRDKRHVSITAYRCTICGYLELYAIDPIRG